MPSDSSPRLVVLVHGAWHGAWSWAPLQAELDRRGVPSLAIDLPGHGASLHPAGDLYDDAAHLGDVLDHLDRRGAGDVVLVGHSYGGAVITHAASPRHDIAHLVYVAAFALDSGESVMSALRSFDRRPVALQAATEVGNDGTTALDGERAVAALYGSCSDLVASAAVARLDSQRIDTMTQAVEGNPRGRVPSTYVRCLHDEAVHPDHQTVMAARCGAVIDLDTDHSPFASNPRALAEILGRIAMTASEPTAGEPTGAP